MEPADAAFAFAALGQATRLDLLRALLDAGPSGLPAGEIAARLGVPGSTLSFHLRALEQAGLIAATRQGRSLIYAVQFARLRALLAFLTEACCGGRPELCGDLAAAVYPSPVRTSRCSRPSSTCCFSARTIRRARSWPKRC